MNNETLSLCITVALIIAIVYVLHEILFPPNDVNLLDKIKDTVYTNTNTNSNETKPEEKIPEIIPIIPTITNVQEYNTPGWTDQGCWKDDTNRTIPIMMNGKIYKTIEECIKEAENTNANVIGLQGGGYCSIGNSNDYKRLGRSTETCDLLGSDFINHVFTKK